MSQHTHLHTSERQELHITYKPSQENCYALMCFIYDTVLVPRSILLHTLLLILTSVYLPNCGLYVM